MENRKEEAFILQLMEINITETGKIIKKMGEAFPL